MYSFISSFDVFSKLGFISGTSSGSSAFSPSNPSLNPSGCKLYSSPGSILSRFSSSPGNTSGFSLSTGTSGSSDGVSSPNISGLKSTTSGSTPDSAFKPLLNASSPLYSVASGSISSVAILSVGNSLPFSSTVYTDVANSLFALASAFLLSISSYVGIILSYELYCSVVSIGFNASNEAWSNFPNECIFCKNKSIVLADPLAWSAYNTVPPPMSLNTSRLSLLSISPNHKPALSSSN